VGEQGLIYCTTEISRKDHYLLPGVCGLNLLKGMRKSSMLEKAQEMVQNAVFLAISRYRKKGIEPTMAFILEGPYAVPVLRLHYSTVSRLIRRGADSKTSKSKTCPPYA
jgi:hypothetical protein